MRIRFTKFDGSPHWEYEVQPRGRDERGRWLFMPSGTFESRPGRSNVTRYDAAIFIPADAEWCARIHGRPAAGDYEIYVDVMRRVSETDDEIVMIDMDLDVVRDASGLWIDDEDEFEAHSRTFGYPAAVIAEARAACEDARLRIAEGRHPFDRASPDIVQALAEAG